MSSDCCLPFSQIGVATEPGSMTGDVHPPRSQLEAQAVGERLQGVLRAGVRTDERRRLPAADRPHVHDPAATAAQRRQQRLRDRDEADDADLELQAHDRRSTRAPAARPARSPRCSRGPRAAGRRSSRRAPRSAPSSVTSRMTGCKRADASPRSASPSRSRRTPASTSKPSRSRCRAHARPMPDEVPVTTTVPRTLGAALGAGGGGAVARRRRAMVAGDSDLTGIPRSEPFVREGAKRTGTPCAVSARRALARPARSCSRRRSAAGAQEREHREHAAVVVV